MSDVVILTGLKARLLKFVTGYKSFLSPVNGNLYAVEQSVTDRLRNHELGIHGAQRNEMGPWKFFFQGVIWHSIKYRGWANTPLEREAVEHQYDTDYVGRRKPFAWKQYI